MELKNIFKMTKTDRYTQDGRDELAKLQETEDVTYKTGDISQKTGLQKQPDGSWAPPKGGAAPKMGSPEYNEKYGLTKRDVATGKEIDRIYEKHQKRIKELKAKGYTDEQIENDKIYQQTKEDMRNVGKNKPAENKPAAENKTTIRQGPNTKTLNETPAEHIKKNWDYYAKSGRYGQGDMEQLVLSPSGYKETESYGVMGGGKRVQYEKEGGEKIALFFNKDGELDDYEIEGNESNPAEEQSGPEKKQLTWSPNASVSEKLNDIIKLGEGSEDRTTGQGKYISPKAQEDYVRKALSKRLGATEESIEDLIDSMDEKAIKNAFNGFMENYSSDSAPRILTGDTRIRIKK